MPEPTTYWAIVPAAGTGERFGADDEGARFGADEKGARFGADEKATSFGANDTGVHTPQSKSRSIPKQYAELAGQPVILHSLATLARAQRFARIVVALAERDSWFGALALPGEASIQRVSGGATRAESVFNALHALRDCAAPNDWVLVHDAARPLLGLPALHRMLDALADDPVGGILAERPHHTVKLAAEAIVGAAQCKRITVKKTLDRNSVWLAHTPQMFRYELLLNALQSALQTPAMATTITDEASAIEQAGLPVRLIESSASNIKITTSADLALAEYYLASGVVTTGLSA